MSPPASGPSATGNRSFGAPLLEAFTLGPLELRNRVMFGACVNNLGRNDEITREQIAFYKARAMGGIAAVVTEGLSVHPSSIPNRTVPLLYDSALRSGLVDLADALHGAGAAAIGQLWHAGRNGLWGGRSHAVAPSQLPDPYSGAYPQTLTDDGVLELVEAFAAAALNLAEAGFDGAEIHGAHGYLVTQFLSPWSNKRTDRWGGSTANRARFVAEIISATRRRCPASFIVGLKISAEEGVRGGLDTAESIALLDALEPESLPDYVTVSQGNFSPSLERHVPDNRFPIALGAGFASEIRAAFQGRLHVIAAGRIPDLATAQQLISTGAADMTALVRPLLADADLVASAVSGESPRPCVYCNVCWDSIHRNRVVTCLYAPETGRELEAEAAAKQVSPRREVHVVGAGPAGLEFARRATAAGARVFMHEAAPRCGGRLAFEALLPGRSEMGAAAAWLEERVRSAGVTITLGQAVDADLVASWPADSIVVQASGAEPIVDPLAGCAVNVSLEAAVRDPDQLVGSVLVVDEIDNEPVYAAVEFIALTGLTVVLMTKRPQIASRVAYISQIGVYRRLDALGVTIVPLSEPVNSRPERLLIRNTYSGLEHELPPIGSVVRAGPYRSTPLLERSGRPGLTLGDAGAPSDLVTVFAGAARAARDLTTLAGAGELDLPVKSDI